MADIANITLKGESEAKNFIDEALRGDIAYEELSTTVSKTGGYVAGDHLIYLGQYYEVVADIAQGGTIVTSGAGQNVEEREVGDEIKKNKTQVLGVICDVETSPATAAHSAGDQFYYDGALVEATSAIAIGDTIVVSPDTGYNVKVADKVVAQIQTLTSAFANNVNENGCKNRFVLTMEQLIKAQKSNGGKWNGNTYTFRGVTFTCNTDDSGIVESVTVNGTATAKSGFRFSHHDDVDVSKEYYKLFSENSYMVTGAKTVPRIVIDVNNGGTWVRTQRITSDSKVTLDLSGGDNITVYIEVPSGETANNVTIYPMLCLKSDYDIDSTYEPYSKTNLQLTQDSVTWDNLSEVGAVNLFDSTMRYKKGQTFSDGVYTMNDDGSVTVNVSSVTGTGSARLAPVEDDSSLVFPAGTYKLSGEGSTNAFFIIIRKNGVEIGGTQNGRAFTFEANGTDYFTVLIRKGTSATVSESFVIKPMITSPSYNGPYVPYAKTNKELTEENKIETGSLTGDLTFSSNEITKKNGIVTINAVFQADKDYNTFTQFASIPSEFRPITNHPIGSLFNDTQKTIISLTAFSSGVIQASAKITAGDYYRMSMTYIIT